MDTKKDFILREIQKLADFLAALAQQKPSKEEIDVYIDEFAIANFNLTISQLLEKPFDEIINLIENNEVENLKDFADVLFIKASFETNSQEKSKLAKIIIGLYKLYQIKTQTFSYEIQTKINELEK